MLTWVGAPGKTASRLGRAGAIGQAGTSRPCQRRRFANLGPSQRRRCAAPNGQRLLPAILFGQRTAQNAGQPKIGRGQAREFLFGGGNGRLELGLAVLRR